MYLFVEGLCATHGARWGPGCPSDPVLCLGACAPAAQLAFPLGPCSRSAPQFQGL